MPLTMLPKILYRGDNDWKNERSLRVSLKGGYVQTNILQGGDGREIYVEPLQSLVTKHVHPGWSKTHFLSFSSDKNIALSYAMRCTNEEAEQKFEGHFENLNDTDDWNFALLECSTDKIKLNLLEPGVYEGLFQANLLEFRQKPYRIILINVVDFLKSTGDNQQYSHAIGNAKRDQEWLILPAFEKQLNFNKVENSGILDLNCFSIIKTYITEDKLNMVSVED